MAERVQITIDEDLDAALQRLALAEGTSKAAVIVDLVRERLKRITSLEADPLWQMIGSDDFPPSSVDDSVYD